MNPGRAGVTLIIAALGSLGLHYLATVWLTAAEMERTRLADPAAHVSRYGSETGTLLVILGLAAFVLGIALVMVELRRRPAGLNDSRRPGFG